eukprot:scaffold19187_cov69-Attheya_sp.AAC.2
MKCMCDMTQFVVVVPVQQTTTAYLARMFMEHVLMKFGVCAIVVVDEGSTFNPAFVDMCACLKLRCHVCARGNHKAVGVEHFHKFLNRAVTIVSNDRGTPAVFVEASVTAAYAWNASLIDGTEIVCSIPAIGHQLKFPLDIDLAPIPRLIANAAQPVVEYVRNLSRDVAFSRELIRILLEDRRTVHRERVNEGRHIVLYKIGDTVMARVQVASNATAGTVGKLTYRSHGPFEIVEDLLSFGAYTVRPLGKPDTATRKYHSANLYLLLPGILPCDPLDTSDFRYMNSDFAPLLDPLKAHLNIESYNSVWYATTPCTHPPKFDYQAPYSTFEAFPMPPFPLLRDLHVSSPRTEFTPAEHSDAPVVSSTATDLLPLMRASVDRLCFIQYTPIGTLRPRWYLVQVNLDDITASLPDFATTGMYSVNFLMRHSDNNHLSDSSA